MSTAKADRVEVLADSLLVTELLVTDERAVTLARRGGGDGATAAVLNMISVGATGLEAMSDA